ncbi:MAG: hypothetical protein GXO19_03630 [Epsilonproteobacteria bacterium]|nr:hypothetical protein [Campylobacterota bacterium]
MRLLLINKNPVVSRMMQMSVPKAGFDIEECESVYDLPTGEYEVVVIDDEMYDQNFLQDIKQNIKYYQLGIITSAKSGNLQDFDFVLTKPFLPTDLIEILRRVKGEIENQKQKLPPPVEPQQKDQEEFGNFLKSEESFLGTEERIVEIEEPQEESPFVVPSQDRGGLFKEEEVQEVAQLLKEPSPEPTISLKEDSPFGREESSPFPEPEITLKSEDLFGKEEKVESVEELGKVEKEEKEDPFASLGAPFETKEEELFKSPSPQPTPQPAPEPITRLQEPPSIDESPTNTPIASSPLSTTEPPISAEALLGEVEEKEVDERGKEQKKPTLEDLKRELGRLDVQGLREILDGMQLEITIKISYPDKKDV